MPDYTGGQFPSLDGHPETEIAHRTEPETDGDWFRKVFTVHNRAHTRGLDADHEVHVANFTGMLQAALQQGLHPKGLPELESEEDHPFDPDHTNLTYRVQVVPAVADHEPETTVTPTALLDWLRQQGDEANLDPEPTPVPKPDTVSTDDPGEGGVQDPPSEEPDSGEFIHSTKPEPVVDPSDVAEHPLAEDPGE